MNELGHISNVIPTSKTNSLLKPFIIVCSTIVVFLAWSPLKKLHLWYCKIETKVDELEKVDLNLQEIQQELKNYDVTAANQKKTETFGPTIMDEAAIGKSASPETGGLGMHCIGKSGKIYTEAMLDALIRE